jgi:glycosyl transferase family 25
MPMPDARIFVINLAHRIDRRRETERELQRVGWTATFFPAILPDAAGGFPSIGCRGVFLSHLAVLKKARDLPSKTLIILEDDLDFSHDFTSQWEGAISALSSHEWSIFYGGHRLKNLPNGLTLIPPSTGVLTTHFVVVNQSAISPLIKGLEEMLSRPPGDPKGGPMYIDGAYSTIRAQNPELTTYAYCPSLGYQRPSRHDIGEVPWFDRSESLAPVIGLLRKLKGFILRQVPIDR